MEKNLPRIDFKKYRTRNYFEGVFVQYSPTPMMVLRRYARTPCPICQPGVLVGRSVNWNFEKCVWYCFRCLRNGDALDLVCMMEKVDIVTAAKMLEDCFGSSDAGLVLDVRKAEPVG